MNKKARLRTTCPACSHTQTEAFFEIEEMPVFCNVLWPDRKSALSCARGDIRLRACSCCGLIFNSAFDSGLLHYTQAYENSLHYSPRFQAYADELAQQLVQKYDLRNKTIVEIGCGKGDFLASLCELGANNGVGFDPSFEAERVADGAHERITFVKDYYGEKYADQSADFVVCRHVLEHIETPSSFLRSIRRTLGNRSDAVVYFEVPNVLFTLRDLAIWDIIYEHCLYFQAESLANLFKQCSFEVLHIAETFGGQFVGIKARPIAVSSEPDRASSVLPSYPSQVSHEFGNIAEFKWRYLHKLNQWRSCFDEFNAANQKVVVWGAGSKGVTFLNGLQGKNHIEYIVDINPNKLGRYVAGTGQRIVSPGELVAYQPDVVIIMNPNYTAEIRDTLHNLGLNPKLLVDQVDVAIVT